MSVQTNIPGVDNYVLQESLSAYSDEAYTSARKIGSTGMVGSNPLIDTGTETFVGQIRWMKPLNPTINIASLTDATDGDFTTFGSEYLTYIKSVRTHGATKVNMAEVVSRDDGLAKVGRDFGTTRATDEHSAVLAILKGVAISEAVTGAAVGSGVTGLGGQTFDNDPEDGAYGFYVDLGADEMVVAPTTAVQGASRAEGFLQAVGMAYKDHESEYYYLIVSPEIYSSLRSANLVDSIIVTDGNVEFNTIFQGKFRLIQTRASQGMTAAELTKINTGAGVDIVGPKTSFVVRPGAIALNALTVPMPTEITRDGASYKGGGATNIFYRWGYVGAPAGYDWAGLDTVFASDASYRYVVKSGVPIALTAATDVLADTTGTWVRKSSSALSLGILPIFHS